MKFLEVLPVLALAAIALSPPFSTSCDGTRWDVDDPAVGLDGPPVSPRTVASSAAEATDRLRVLTYNVFMRPDPVGWGDAGHCRAREIGERLAERAQSLDLVVLNESFDERAVDQLTDALGDVFPYRALRKPDREFLSTNGGLSMFSQYPIRELYSESFDSCSSWGDCFAEKGFLHAVVEVSPAMRVNILATHLDAGDIADSASTRLSQLSTIRDYIDRRGVGSTWPTMLMGDLNVDGSPGLVAPPEPDRSNRSEYQNMLSTFARSCQACAGEHCLGSCGRRPVDAMRMRTSSRGFARSRIAPFHTMNCRNQSLEPCRSTDAPSTWRNRQRLDYVLELRTHTPSRAEAEFVDAEHLPFRNDTCGTTYLSDHKAVRADLRLRPGPVARTTD